MDNPTDLLIIAHHFPPHFEMVGGTIRMMKLAAFLERRGHRVALLAALGPDHGYFGYKDLVCSLDITYLLDPLRGRGKPRSSRVLGHNQEAHQFGLTTPLKAIARDLLVPDAAVLSVPAFYRAAATAITTRTFKNVLISSPPHSMQLVGLMLKRTFGDSINVIMDYRDGWNSQPLFAKHNPISRTLNRWCERACLTQADHVTYVSDPILRRINESICDISKKATRVMNGFDPGMLPSDSPRHIKGKRLVIGHFGHINTYQRRYRDPTLLVHAIRELDLPITLVFFGRVDVDPEWHRLLGDRLEIRGDLPHPQAIAEMRRVDTLLLLHTLREGSEEVVSGKLFDYIMAKRPIIVAGPPEMEAMRIVGSQGLGYSVDILDPSRVLIDLRKVYDDWQGGLMPNLDQIDISGFSRDRQYEKILSLLKS